MTAATAPVVRVATNEDIPGMLQVLRAAYGEWPSVDLDTTPLEHLRWKMSARDGLEPEHLVILVDDQIVVTRLRWQNRIQVGGRTYLNETGADLAVHPDFRGRGLARLMVDTWVPEFRADPKASLSMRSTAPEVQTMDFPDEIVRPINTWHRPFRWRAYLGVHRRAGLGALLRAPASWRWAIRHPRAEGLELRELESFDQRFDRLWESARNAFDVIPFRTAAYLAWRFARPEAGNASIVGVSAGEDLVAYAVVKRSGDVGQLQDLLWHPDHPQALPLAIEGAAHLLRSQGASGVTCWLPERHPAEQILRRAGFAAVGRQSLLAGSPSEGLTPAEVLQIVGDESSSMHITMSDFDWV